MNGVLCETGEATRTTLEQCWNLLEYSERPEDLPGPAMLYNSCWRKAPSVRSRTDAEIQMNHHVPSSRHRTYTYPYKQVTVDIPTHLWLRTLPKANEDPCIMQNRLRLSVVPCPCYVAINEKSLPSYYQ